MSIWCPRCKYKSVLKRFYDDRCPQCRTVVGVGEALTKDPYSPQQGNKQSGMRKHDNPNKKFTFDQPVSDLKSIPTDTLNMYKQDK